MLEIQVSDQGLFVSFVSFSLFLTVASANEWRKQRIYMQLIFTFPQLIFLQGSRLSPVDDAELQISFKMKEPPFIS
jgi:hypothetical protein